MHAAGEFARHQHRAQFGYVRLRLCRRTNEGLDLPAHRAVERDHEESKARVVTLHAEDETVAAVVARFDEEGREHRVQPRADHADVARQQRDRGDAAFAEPRAGHREIAVEARAWQRDGLLPADPRLRLTVERAVADGDRFDVARRRWRGGGGLGCTQRDAAAGQARDARDGARLAGIVVVQRHVGAIAHRQWVEEFGLDAPALWQHRIGPAIQHSQQGMHTMHDRAPREQPARGDGVHVQRVAVARQSGKSLLVGTAEPEPSHA